MTVSILGCGWFGLAFAKSLVSEGIRVKGSTTSDVKLPLLKEERIEPYRIDLSLNDNVIDISFFHCDILVINISPGKNKEIYSQMMSHLIDLIKIHQVKKVMLISATSVYGNLNSEVDELTEPNPDTPAGKLLLQVESFFRAETSFTTTIIRFAGLVGPGRDPGRFLAGKQAIPNGLAPVNLIHRDDCVGICSAMVHNDLFVYTINACAPHHPTRKEFYTKASAKANFDIPQFIDELHNWKVIESIYLNEIVIYDFSIADWMEWLER
jgi:nucleoside-diphosphate-sugar epimerase